MSLEYQGDDEKRNYRNYAVITVITQKQQHEEIARNYALRNYARKENP